VVVGAAVAGGGVVGGTVVVGALVVVVDVAGRVVVVAPPSESPESACPGVPTPKEAASTGDWSSVATAAATVVVALTTIVAMTNHTILRAFDMQSSSARRSRNFREFSPSAGAQSARNDRYQRRHVVLNAASNRS